MPNKRVKVGDNIYEIPSEQGTAIVNSLVYVWDKLGKPDDVFTDPGRKLMMVIISTWEDTFPKEAAEWKAIRDDYQGTEKSIHEQVKQGTGRSLASVPYYVFFLMKKFYTANEFNRDFWIKLAREWPQWRMANKI